MSQLFFSFLFTTYFEFDPTKMSIIKLSYIHNHLWIIFKFSTLICFQCFAFCTRFDRILIQKKRFINKNLFARNDHSDCQMVVCKNRKKWTVLITVAMNKSFDWTNGCIKMAQKQKFKQDFFRNSFFSPHF